MSIIILSLIAILVLIGSIYLAVSKESKLMKFGVAAFAVLIISQLVLTSFFILI